LRSIFDTTPLIPQTAKAIDGQIVTSLTPTYLCLQCPSTLTEDDRTKHGTKKSHRFCMFGVVGGGWRWRVSAAY
jgi:ubiquitin carboxyl-terminal hydrolase 22/27/51